MDHSTSIRGETFPVRLADAPGSFVVWGGKKKKLFKSNRFMTRLRRYATAACDSAESTTSRVVIYKNHSHALISDTVPSSTNTTLSIVLGAVQIFCVLHEQINHLQWRHSKVPPLQCTFIAKHPFLFNQINQTAPQDVLYPFQPKMLQHPFERSARLEVGTAEYVIRGHPVLYDLSSSYCVDTNRRSSAWRYVS